MTSAKELIALTQTVTNEELIEHLNTLIRRPDGKSGNSLECAICQTDAWILTPYPEDNTRPVIASTPIPFSQNRATWYFPLSCENCGYTIFLEAQTVTRAVIKRRES